MNFTENSLAFKPYITTLYILIYFPVWIAIICGNLVVMLAFVYHRELRRVQNYFLVSLAATDFLTGLVALPLHLVARLVVSQVTCLPSSRFIFFLPVLIFSSASAFHHLCIAIEGLLSLICPLKYSHIVTSCRMKVVIATIWLCNFAFAFSPLYVPHPATDEWVCSYNQHYGDEVKLLYLIAAFGIPAFSTLMFLLYTFMLAIAYQKIKMHRKLSNNVAVIDAKKHFRGVVTMATVVGAFVVCLVPTSFKLFFEIYISATKEVLVTVETLCEFLLFLNSMLNPIIYGCLNQQFRAGFKEVLQSLKCKSALSSFLSLSLQNIINESNN
ncbi:Histamine H2 receptor [Holothuria leucospilota]|uniref:Histamine H2 receptor n=1 Tax=Holothuria leucospilota TaxID=206669 RepID=A0A9Q1HGR9_HOLLE|nr:Histamine H2 receptor [Holothuria leucospilota]